MSDTEQLQKDRAEAYEEAAKLRPKRYTSDPDVINNPEAMAAVMAEWEIYFRAMDAALARFPYTEEEKLHRDRDRDRDRRSVQTS
jgi:hypothetical protein